MFLDIRKNIVVRAMSGIRASVHEMDKGKKQQNRLVIQKRKLQFLLLSSEEEDGGDRPGGVDVKELPMGGAYVVFFSSLRFFSLRQAVEWGE